MTKDKIRQLILEIKSDTKQTHINNILGKEITEIRRTNKGHFWFFSGPELIIMTDMETTIYDRNGNFFDGEDELPIETLET